MKNWPPQKPPEDLANRALEQTAQNAKGTMKRADLNATERKLVENMAAANSLLQICIRDESTDALTVQLVTFEIDLRTQLKDLLSMKKESVDCFVIPEQTTRRSLNALSQANARTIADALVEIFLRDIQRISITNPECELFLIERMQELYALHNRIRNRVLRKPYERHIPQKTVRPRKGGIDLHDVRVIPPKSK